MKTNYEQLKKDYPEVISINQFYQICHIAKRSAVYLLENGIVPYTDTGKLTWKYKIKLDDVIAYITPEQLNHNELLYRLDISSRHYYRIRQQAINILSIRLWAVPAQELDAWLEILTLLEAW